jgi:hypothetical protein
VLRRKRVSLLQETKLIGAVKDRAMKCFLLLLPLFAGCAFSGVRGNGDIRVDTREIGEFVELEVSGSFDVAVDAGEAPTLTIEADDNLLPLIESRLSGGVLKIENSEQLSPSKRIKIRATTPSLRRFAISGSADARLENLAGESFTIDSSGSSDIVARGTVGTLEIDVSGSSDVVAPQLVAERVKIDASGSCEVVVTAKEWLDVDSSGSCDVRYHGRPALKVDVSGSGSVEPVIE